MSQPLPGALDLIKSSWRLFTKTWTDTVKISIWFIYFGLAQFAAALIERSSPFVGSVLGVLVTIGMAILGVWVGIRLLRAALAVDAGGKVDVSPAESRAAWSLVLPLLLVGILQTLIVLGGAVLLILPAIFLGVALSFSQLSVIDQGLRGTKAIAASFELVKNRWWATFWREIAVGVVFGVGLMIAVGILMSVIAAIVGTASFTSANPNPIVSGTFSLLQSIIQAAVLPLFVIAQVKIYRALQNTK